MRKPEAEVQKRHTVIAGVPTAGRLMVMLAQLFEDRPFLSLLLWLRWRVSCCCNCHEIRDHSALQLQLGCSLCCTALRMLALCRASWASGTLGFLFLVKLVSWVWAFHLTPLHGLLVPRPVPLPHLPSSCLCTCHYLTVLCSDTLFEAIFMFTHILFRCYMLRFLNGSIVLFHFSTLVLCVPVCTYVLVVQAPMEARARDLPGAGVPGGCESPVDQLGISF